MLSKSCFSVIIASHFEIVVEEYSKELKDKSENENTMNSTERRKDAFIRWTNERNLQANLEEYESDVFEQTLSQFYAFRNSEIFPLVINKSNGSS